MHSFPVHKFNKAFILLPVVITLGVLAAIAYLLSRESAVNTGNVNREQQQDIALYTAQAAYNHAIWQLNQQNCAGYSDIPATTFGNQSYSASVTDATNTPLTAGSPANIQVVSTLDDGTSYRINRYREKIYQYPLTTLTLQLGTDPGKDAMLDGFVMNRNKNYGAYKQQVSDVPVLTKHQLIQFDLPDLSVEADIISAQLQLKQKSMLPGWNAFEITLYRMKQAWVEGTKSGTATAGGATWDKPDGSGSWVDGMSGGAYDTTAIANIAITPTNIVRRWNVTELVKGWHKGRYANEGMLLKGSGPESVEFASKEDATIVDRPKLTITYQCECGKICCSADYIANSKLLEFDWDVTASDIWDISYLPAGTVIFGVTVPADGGWVLIDSANLRFYVTDSAGSALIDTPTPGPAKGVTFISAGTWEDHLALSDPATQTINFVDMTGNIQGSFSTASTTENPLGLAFINTTADGTYDTHFAIASNKNSAGGSVGSIFIVDETGTLQTTININSLTPEPYAVAHLSGTNKLLMASKNNELFIIDFAGNLYHQYDTNVFGLTQLQGVAINPFNCQHVIVSKDSQSVAVLESL